MELVVISIVSSLFILALIFFISGYLINNFYKKMFTNATPIYGILKGFSYPYIMDSRHNFRISNENGPDRHPIFSFDVDGKEIIKEAEFPNLNLSEENIGNKVKIFYDGKSVFIDDENLSTKIHKRIPIVFNSIAIIFLLIAIIVLVLSTLNLF